MARWAIVGAEDPVGCRSQFPQVWVDGPYVASAAVPLGVIWDVDPGSCHLVVYREGILALPVRLLPRIQFAARYVRGGAPTDFRDLSSKRTGEERRLIRLVTVSDPDQIAASEDQAFFLDEAGIQRIGVRYRFAFSAIDIWPAGAQAATTYKWTPSMNPLPPVRRLLRDAFNERFAS